MVKRASNQPPNSTLFPKEVGSASMLFRRDLGHGRGRER